MDWTALESKYVRALHDVKYFDELTLLVNEMFDAMVRDHGLMVANYIFTNRIIMLGCHRIPTDKIQMVDALWSCVFG